MHLPKTEARFNLNDYNSSKSHSKQCYSISVDICFDNITSLNGPQNEKVSSDYITI